MRYYEKIALQAIIVKTSKTVYIKTGLLKKFCAFLTARFLIINLPIIHKFFTVMTNNVINIAYYHFSG